MVIVPVTVATILNMSTSPDCSILPDWVPEPLLESVTCVAWAMVLP